jgi:hypothetical protein
LQEAGLSLNLAKSAIVPFSASAPKGVVSFLGFDFYWGRNKSGGRLLKYKTAAKRLHRSMQAFTDWVKATRNRKPLKQLWADAAARLAGHFNYFGVRWNEAKLSHYRHVCIGSLFKWLNRRSQKRSFSWEQFERRQHFHPLPPIPRGEDLIAFETEHRAVRKHQPKSRMREIRTSGSVGDPGGMPPGSTRPGRKPLSCQPPRRHHAPGAHQKAIGHCAPTQPKPSSSPRAANVRARPSADRPSKA